MVKLKNGDLITAGLYGSIRRWRTGDGESLSQPVDTGQSGVYSMIQLKNGDLVTAGYDGTIRIWNMENKKQPKPKSDPIESSQGLVLSLVALKNSGFYTGGTDGTIRDWKLSNFNFRVDSNHGLGRVSSLVELKNGDLITGGENGWFRCWRKGELNPQVSVYTDQGKLLSMVALDNGELITGGENGKMRRWSSDCINIKKIGEPIQVNKGGPINSMVQLTKDELVTGGFGNIRRWRVGKDGINEIAASIGNHNSKDLILSMVKLKNGELITGDENGKIRRWNREGKPLGAPVSTGSSPIVKLLELESGKLITVSNNKDGTSTIRRWRVGKTIDEIDRPIKTDQGSISSIVEFNSDEVITGGEKGTIRTWRAGKPSSDPVRAKGPVTSMLMLKNRELITGEGVKFRRWPPKELIVKKACEMLNKSQSDPRAEEDAWKKATEYCHAQNNSWRGVLNHWVAKALGLLMGP
jgi:WD40 repeat protein